MTSPLVKKLVFFMRMVWWLFGLPYVHSVVLDLGSTLTFLGTDDGESAGAHVAHAGDVNGDGVDDILIGASKANATDGGAEAGAVYLVYGDALWKNRSSFALSALATGNGSVGLVFRGDNMQDYAGLGLAAGDINGDGLSDVVIGAYGSDIGGDATGSSYVIYGKHGKIEPTSDGIFELGMLSQMSFHQTGIVIQGDSDNDKSGSALAVVDVNVDGYADVLIGATSADYSSNNAGDVFVVYGKDEGLSRTSVGSNILDLKTLADPRGALLAGVGLGDRSGRALSGGDFNGDGISDILVGAYNAKWTNASLTTSRPGVVYMVYGRANGFSGNGKDAHVFRLETVSASGGSLGVELQGETDGDRTGLVNASAGDVNGDGKDDALVCAHAAAVRGPQSGRCYLVFGRNTNNLSDSGVFRLSSLTTGGGEFGVDLIGKSASDVAGGSAAGLGDINKDGYDDIAIGAYGADGQAPNGGAVYMLFGGPGGVLVGNAAGQVDLGTLASGDGSAGVVLYGNNGNDRVGQAVASAGDFDGDGAIDVMVGAVGLTNLPGRVVGGVHIVWGDDILQAVAPASPASPAPSESSTMSSVANPATLGAPMTTTITTNATPDESPETTETGDSTTTTVSTTTMMTMSVDQDSGQTGEQQDEEEGGGVPTGVLVGAVVGGVVVFVLLAVGVAVVWKRRNKTEDVDARRSSVEMASGTASPYAQIPISQGSNYDEVNVKSDYDDLPASMRVANDNTYVDLPDNMKK